MRIAQDFVASGELLLPFLHTFALPSWSCFLKIIYPKFMLESVEITQNCPY
jgi:hypothetical protein